MKRLIVILGVLSLSLSSVMVRLSTAPSSILVVYRVFFAVLLLAPSVFLRHRQELLVLTRREALLCLASGFFLGLHFVVGFESYRGTSIAAATVLINTEVFFVAMGSVLFLRQKLSKTAWFAMLLTFLGSVVVALAGAGGGSQLYGNLLAIISALFMTFYTMIGALIIGSVRNILNLLHVSVYMQNIIVGVIIIAVVAFSMMMKARREQKTSQFKSAAEVAMN